MKGFKDTTRAQYVQGGDQTGPKGAARVSQAMAAFKKGVPGGCGKPQVGKR